MYEIEFTKTAESQFLKLDKELQLRIRNVLKRICVRPYPHVARLVGSPFYRLRVGRYRIVLDICDEKVLIYVIKLGHRENIYL